MSETTIISRDDATRVVRKMRRGGAAAALRRTAASVADGRQRTVDQWSTPEVEQQWYDVPAVQRRWAKMVSGDAKVDFRQHIAKQYLTDGKSRRALSLGCGFGEKELEWARLGVFDEHVGVDFAPPAVEHASAAAREAGFAPEKLRFEVGDIKSTELRQQTYDVVIFEHSLHHFTDVPGTLSRVRRVLRPGGLLVFDEYVGPERFQWTSRQVRAADSLMKLLPTRYRTRSDGRVQASVRRPSLLAMRVADPSEAIESERIMPATRAAFDIIEDKGYGGAVLHPLLSGIAQHFMAEDDTTRSLLDMCFFAEDALLEAGEVAHDFKVVVARA